MAPTLRLRPAAVLSAALLALADCSSGSTASPFIAPSTSPATVTAAIPASGGTVSLPQTTSGESASLAVTAGAPSGATITATVSDVAPGNAPAPSARHRSSAIVGAKPFFFVTFSVSQTVSSSIFASEVVKILSSFPSSAAYYAEFDDITSPPGTKLACAGPGSVAQLSATITNTVGYGACANSGGAGVTSFVPGRTYLMQFYYVVGTSSPTPSPTSSPTSSPTPVPTASPTPGAILVTPSSLYFSGNSPAPQTFTASESGFSGAFTSSNTCAGYATVSGSSPTFTVTATAAPASPSTAPTCTVTVSNGIGGSASVNVYISTVGVTVNARGARP